MRAVGRLMNPLKRIKKLLQEAELYRAQGLLTEAKGNYSNAAELIKKNQNVGGG